MVTQEELEIAFADTKDNYVIIDEVFFFRLPDGRFWCPSRQNKGVRYKYVEPTWADENHEISTIDAKDFTVVEVETTEINNKTYPCQIGLAIVHDGKIEERFCELVKTPGNRYGSNKTKMYGITPDMTEEARLFRPIWDEIKVHFDGQMIVSFDGTRNLMALHNALKKYDIEEPEITGYYSISHHAESKLKKLLSLYEVPENLNSDCGALSTIMANIYLSLSSGESLNTDIINIEQAQNNLQLLLDSALKEKNSQPLNMFAEKNSFVAIDFEKVDHSQTSICEIGMVKFVDGREVDSYQSIIKPLMNYVRTQWAKENLQHISDKDISNAPTFRELHSTIKNFIGDSLLVCHNISADINYIYNLEKEQKLTGTYSHGFADTMEIGKKIVGVSALDKLYRTALKKPMGNHHHALDDARACGEIYASLLDLPIIEAFTHHEEYLPASEKESSINHYVTQNISTEGLKNDMEDNILGDYDFNGKAFVISGESIYRERITAKLKSLGALPKSSLSSRTDAFIVSDNAGPSKIEKAKELKAKKSEKFHIFTHEGLAKLLDLF